MLQEVVGGELHGFVAPFRRAVDAFSQVEALQAATAGTAKRTITVTIPNADHGYGFYSDQPDVDAALHTALVQFFKRAL